MQDFAVSDTPELILAHDYLIQMGGAERVVASMVRRYPTSPLYTSAVRRDTLLPEFENADIRTSWMQRLPGIKTQFKKYFASLSGVSKSCHEWHTCPEGAASSVWS